MAVYLDSHVHFWDPGRFDYPWLDAQPVLNRPFLPADLDPSIRGADGLIVVQADCLADQATAEVEWLTTLAQAGAPIRGIVAHARLEFGASCSAQLGRLAEGKLVVGVRRLLQDCPPGFALQDDFVTGVRSLGAYGLVMDLCIRHHQLPDVVLLVERCPEVSFVLDHLGKPGFAAAQRRPWAKYISRLAALPNVSCKLSGLTSEADAVTRNEADLRPYLEHVVEAFGPQRCMFGSDWPVAITSITYQGWLELVLAAVSGGSDSDRQWIMRDTAAAVYRRAATET